MSSPRDQHLQEVVLARQKANELMQDLEVARLTAAEALTLTSVAVGERPQNPEAREALERMLAISSRIVSLMQSTGEVKDRLDGYAGTF